MRRLFVTGCLMLMLRGAAPAQEAWLTALYQPVPGGYRYYLTVYNGMAPESNDYIWSVNARLMGGWDWNAWDLEWPPNWEYSSSLGSQVFWMTGPGSGYWLEGIPPGGILSGFNLSTPDLWASFQYRIMWYDGSYGSGVFGYASPTLIPEPGSLVALAAGLLALGALAPRLRRG